MLQIRKIVIRIGMFFKIRYMRTKELDRMVCKSIRLNKMTKYGFPIVKNGTLSTPLLMKMVLNYLPKKMMHIYLFITILISVWY